MRTKRIRRKSGSGFDESVWRDAVLARDGHQCQLSRRDRCDGRLAAHHVVFKGRDPSRRLSVDNGATLCRKHHEWVHANSSEARDRYGLAGHATDIVKDGRVVGPRGHPAGLIIIDDPPPRGQLSPETSARFVAFAEELGALRAARPRRPE